MKQNRTGPPEASIILQNKSFNNNKIITKAVFQRSSGRERRKEKRKSVASNFSLLLPFFVCRRCRRNTRHAWHILSDWMSFRGQITFSKAIKRRCVTKLLCVYVYMFACVCVCDVSLSLQISVYRSWIFFCVRVYSLFWLAFLKICRLFSLTPIYLVFHCFKNEAHAHSFLFASSISHIHIYTLIYHICFLLSLARLCLCFIWSVLR